MANVAARKELITRVTGVTIVLNVEEAIALAALVGSFGDEYRSNGLYVQLWDEVVRVSEDNQEMYAKFKNNAHAAIKKRAYLIATGME